MAILRAPVSLTTADYKFLTEYLKLMKDALVGGVEEGTDDAPADAQESDG